MDVGVAEGPSVGDGDAVAVTVLVPEAVGVAEGGGVCSHPEESWVWVFSE